MRFSLPHRRRRVFSFFDFRSSFPVFPTSLKLRAKKDLSKIDYAKAWDYLTFLRAGCSSVACECPTVIEEKHYEDIGAEFFHESFLSLEESKKWWPILWILSEGLGRRHGLKLG